MLGIKSFMVSVIAVILIAALGFSSVTIIGGGDDPTAILLSDGEYITLTISPSYTFGVGSMTQLAMTISPDTCGVQVIQLTSYCDAEDGRPSIESSTQFESYAPTPPDAFDNLFRQAAQAAAQHNADWMDTGVLDGDIVRLTLYAGDQGLELSGVNADEEGPEWFTALCDQLKGILTDAGVDLDEAYKLY